MSNKILFNPQEKLLRGINKAADAVGSTLGPKGRNVFYQDGPFTKVTHDGVTVIRRIDLKDPFENMGVQVLREAATKTNDIAGDGTTTATVLAQAIINAGMKHINDGVNPQTLKKEIEDALAICLKQLEKLTKPVRGKDIEQVATISSADPELGRIVAEALITVGKNGHVAVEEGSGFVTTVDYKQGMEIDRGYLSHHFITNQDKVEAVVDNAYILLTDLRVGQEYEIVPFLEKFVKAGHKNLVIIGDVATESEALATIIVNRLRGAINAVVIHPPAWGGRRLDELEDLAILTGGTVVTAASGRLLDSIELAELGQAQKVVSDRDKTIITGAKGTKAAIAARIADLQEQVKVANTEYDKEIKKQRIAKLAGGVAVIKVGANTEVALKEKVDRVIDAVHATRAAIEEGIVAGGGRTLIALADGLEKNSVLEQALRQPFRKLIENAGMNYDLALTFLGTNDYPCGYNVMTNQRVDMLQAGIIDPVKVTRSALENAVSVATMIITAACLIGEEKE
jgi:chaperonin GroEL